MSEKTKETENSTTFKEHDSLSKKENIAISKEKGSSFENRETEGPHSNSLKKYETADISTVSLEKHSNSETHVHALENHEIPETLSVSLENSLISQTHVHTSKNHKTSETSTASTEDHSRSKISTSSLKSHEASDPFASENKIFKWNRFASWLRFCDIEFLLMLFGVGTSFLSSFHDNLVYHRICVHQMENEHQKCYNIENTPNISRYELQLEDVLDAASSHISALLTVKLVIEFLSSIFLCPWSDSYGRKFPIIIAIIGGNFDLMAYFFTDSGFDEFFQVLYSSSVLSSAFGGTVCIFAMSYSYGTEHSTLGFRTFKFSTMDIAFVTGRIIGAMVLRNFSSEHAFLYNSLLIVLVNIISAVWIFFVFEDKYFEGNNRQILEKFIHIFSTTNAGSNFRTLSKWRRDCEGEQLRLIIFSVAPVFIAHGMSEGTVTSNDKHVALFRDAKQYNLRMQLFGLYTCVTEFVCMVFIHLFLKLQDSTIGLLGIFSLYVPCFITAFVSRQSTLMIALTLAAVKSFASVALRSITSKIIQPDEIGRTFLFISFSEAISLTVGYIWHLKRSFLFGKRTYPDFSYLLLCTLLVVPFCLFMFQALSIHTTQLFRKCYRTVPIPMDDIPAQVEDTKEKFDS